MTKTVNYSHTNSYETLNQLSAGTKNIWICFHGLGYLATYFKRYFESLSSEDNYCIVLQAPSKSYIGKDFKHVGACWLTKVDTDQEMENNLKYIKASLENERIIGDARIILFGYSQGVSIATRFFTQYHYPIKALIMHSGKIPDELNQDDAAHFTKYCDQFIHISGTKDEYATEDLEKLELEKLKALFGTNYERHRPEITHVVHVPLLEQIAKKLAI